MLDNPIVILSQLLSSSGTVRGPAVVPEKAPNLSLIDTGVNALYGGAGITKSSIYKVKLIANGKTFNMLLPPSIESKHPGRSNPLQLPGLQIKAGVNISKLKIPGFFPIYQNLGVETLTVSMSGMFTGYDGTDIISTAGNWENSISIGDSTDIGGQDSFASASELYDFAVNNKALVQVTIYTSDGSFIPKKSTSTAFRDTASNISFKGYIKEFEQVYIRQDRNYYMLKFEIIDFGNNKCKTVVKSDKKKADAKTPLPTIGSCIDNLSTTSIKDIQKVLNQKGVYFGPIDGQNNAPFNAVITSSIKNNKITIDANCNYSSGNLTKASLADLFRDVIPSPINLNNNNSNVIDIKGNPISINQQQEIAMFLFRTRDQKNFAYFAIDPESKVAFSDITEWINNPLDLTEKDALKYIGNTTQEYPMFNKTFNNDYPRYVTSGRYIAKPSANGKVDLIKL